MGTSQPVTRKDIIKGWRELSFSDGSIEDIHCIKDSFKSSIWQANLSSAQFKQPIIIKIFKPLSRERRNNTVEKNIYRKARTILHGLMPDIYHIQRKVIGRDVWVVMEYVRPLQGQITFAPSYFDKIIPSLAQLHGRTFNESFHSHHSVFKDWLPQYGQRNQERDRHRTHEKTIKLIDEAMKRKDLYTIIQPSYNRIQKIMRKGPHYFPQLIEAGQSIIHNDLQIPNMGCNNVNDQQWSLKFIDWEGAHFAPCWFDMVNLVGVFLAYRTDWRKQEEAIVKHCVELYTSEMNKQGITFRKNPVTLYKMAYLQRILEKGLYLQLNWELTGRKKAHLLHGYIDKINRWGKELIL